MRSTRSALFIGLAALVLPSCWSAPSRAEPPPTSQMIDGRALAQGTCGPCHVVSADGHEAPILRPPAPSLLDVVRRSSFSEGFLRRFLASGHGRTPPPGAAPHPPLTEEQTSAVVAYILSLKGGK